MYQLTCPSCSSQESSSFVRHGAVVRCASCEQRYRVKSSFVSRTVTTGPKTLDEMDPLLRGDSVDLDQVAAVPDDAAPVKIDEDGNVVGLSGLSELMRQSDAAHAQATAIARTRASDNTPPPAARVTRAAEPALPAAAAPRAAPPRTPRPRRGKAKKSNGIVIAGALVALAVAIGVLAFVVISLNKAVQPIAENPDGPGTTPGPGADPANPNTGPNNPDMFPDVPGTTPDPPDPGPDGRDPDWLTSGAGKEPNPDYQYEASAVVASAIRPTDVPTVLTVAEPMTHEGWYILTPPRGSVEATGVSDLELGGLEPAGGVGDVVALVGELTNRGEEHVLSGEAHVALLDASGRVFAETYLPFAALEPGESQPVRLTIPLRHWGRARDVRTRAVALETARRVDELPGVEVAAAGSGAWASARVSAHNAGGRWLRDAAVLLWAEDSQGNLVAQFRSVQDDLYIEPGAWLDIVVRTPLPESAGALTWRARVIRR